MAADAEEYARRATTGEEQWCGDWQVRRPRVVSQEQRMWLEQ